MKALLVFIPILGAIIYLTDNNGPLMQDPDEVVFEKGMTNNIFAEDNELCLRCHSENMYELTDTILGVKEKRHMCEDYFIERDDYYQSNHWSFACTDCHSDEFKKFPHQVFERLEEHFACNDCHAYDDDYAQYQFENIEVEYIESTHVNVEGFSCWKCHNPHSYKITNRNTINLEETILYDNNICLACHGNFKNYELLTDHEEVNIVRNHEWLPNEATHFKNVRCIECHTEINDSILVAHKLLPKDQAVKRCTECHSSDSRLLTTLYKFQSVKLRRDAGFVNGVILNQSYVIGANRNKVLNALSFIIFGGLLLVILFHTTIRIVKRK
ncbi:MAG TPA: hypothetical protein VMW76_10365 [Bacteroidales bacterium]|nr:hypothetical protein [Bacteroidales bacterium]